MSATIDRVVSPTALPRRNFVKCRTDHCHTILGEWLERPQRLVTTHPAVVPLDGRSPITLVCPHCGDQRTIELR